MYADNRLGGAGCVFERLEECEQSVTNVLSQHSISGFGIPIDSHKQYGGSVHELHDDIVGRAVSLQNIICRCLNALHETDGMEALENQISTIRFDETNADTSDISRIISTSKGIEIGKSLLTMDMKVQIKTGLGLSDVEDRLAITSCLGNLGMRDTLRLLQCGEWLIGNKVDSAITVPNNYLKPSAKLAQTIHHKKHTSDSSKFMYISNFQLADFVANLYDSAEARVNSHE